MQSIANFFGGYTPLKNDPQTMESQSMSEMVSTSIPMHDMMSSAYNMDTTPTSMDSISSQSSTISSQTSILSSQQHESSISSQSSQPMTTSSTSSQSTSWFGSLWSSSVPDEMNTIYDVESQSTIQTTTPHEQQMSKFQTLLLQFINSKYYPFNSIKLPELTYPQKLLSFSMFALGGLFLLLNALLNLTTIFFGGAGKFALSFTMANIFFIVASLFITNPTSHFQPHRRFTTFLYLGTIFGTLFTALYIPYAIFVLPMLVLQLGALVFHILSFFTSAVNVEYNIGQAILTSVFRQAI